MSGDSNPAKRPEVRKKLSEMFQGENNPMYGTKLTEDHKNKLLSARRTSITDGVTLWESIVSYTKDNKIGFQKYKQRLQDGIIWILP
jgi:hypothetical protein